MPPHARAHHEKRHLFGNRRNRTACGLVYDPNNGLNTAAFATNDPSLVTCGTCRRTLAMAEAELAQQQERRRH